MSSLKWFMALVMRLKDVPVKDRDPGDRVVKCDKFNDPDGVGSNSSSPKIAPINCRD